MDRFASIRQRAEIRKGGAAALSAWRFAAGWAAMQGWAMEAGLPAVHVSRICAMPIGENRAEGADGGDEAG